MKKEITQEKALYTRWVDPKPVKPKYTRPVFYPNPYTPDPYLTRPPELTGLVRSDLWCTLVGKTSKGRNLIKVAIGGPMWASHLNFKKLMIDATYGGSLWARHPAVEI